MLVVIMACDPVWSVSGAMTVPSTTTVSKSCVETGLRSTGGVVTPTYAGFRVELPEGAFDVASTGPSLLVEQRAVGGYASEETVALIRSGRSRIFAALAVSCGPLDEPVRETCRRAVCE